MSAQTLFKKKNNSLSRYATTGVYLSHGHSPLLSERVVIQIEDSKSWIVLHGFGQGGHTCVVDAILGHVNLLHAAHKLERQTLIVHVRCLHIKDKTVKIYFECVWQHKLADNYLYEVVQE